jgi:hypothetical protein
MSDRPDIFRPEAIEHRKRPEAPGDVVRIGPRWTTVAFWILLILFSVGVIAAAQIQVERYARGPTASDAGGRVVVLVPAALAPDVTPGSPVDIGGTTARVVSAGETILYPTDVKERYGIDVAAPSIPLVTSASAADVEVGTARVLVEKENLMVALVPGLKVLFGDGDE